MCSKRLEVFTISKGVFYKLRKTIQHPNEVYNWVIQKVKNELLWEYYFSTTRKPKAIWCAPRFNPKTDAIIDQLKQNGLCVADFKIDLDEFSQYLEKAQYTRFPNYYGGGKGLNFIEKSLEHYLAAKTLQISGNDVYIDIASSNSPAAEVYHKLYGCETYRQDLIFPRGIHRNTIGGNASNMPITDGFATKMALHCSFEHFENDSDISFIKEASRVLRKGGKLCIVPLYLFDIYMILTNPVNLSRKERKGEGTLFDSDATLYCSKEQGLRYGRFYDVSHLISRIITNCNLRPIIYVIRNEKEVDDTCYAKFIALFEKTETE